MSYVSNTGLSYYHSKMKTLLAGKSNTDHTHNYAASSTVGGGAIKLESKGGNVGFYATTNNVDVDTHILKLGYFTCTKNYDNLILLITSSFYGAQHGSSDIITVYQDSNTGKAALGINRIRLGSSREFYYKIDDANSRVWLYVQVKGGNSYGRWNISIVQQSQTSWTTELAKNFTLAESDRKVIPDYLALTSHSHDCLTNAEIDKMF